MLTILLMVFTMVPDLVPKRINITVIDWILSIPFFGLFSCLFFSIGFINAVNTVDGANGLVSGIFLIACYLFSQEMDSVVLQAGLWSASLFLIFNVISGKLFLGDAGAYGIGAGMLLASLTAYSNGIYSLSFLAVLFFYPCFDFLVSLIRRGLAGQSLTSPDNDHLHNRLNSLLLNVFRSKNLANSVTGLSISLGSAGVCVVGYESGLIEINSDGWLPIFIAQCGIYGITFFLCGVRKR